MPNVKTDQSHYDDETSLFELFETLRRRWTIVFAFTLGVPALSLAIALAWPKQFEVIALIHLARVGNTQAAITGNGSLTVPVESAGVVIERIQADSFENNISRQIGAPISIHADEPKGTGLVRLIVRTRDPILAERAVNGIVEILTGLHTEQSKGAVATMNESLTATEAEIARTSASIKDLVKKASEITQRDPFLAVMLSQMHGQLMSKASALQEQRSRLVMALSPLNTNPTRLLQSVSSEPTPVSPKIHMVGGISLLIGGFIGVLMALIMQAWENRYDSDSKSVQESISTS